MSTFICSFNYIRQYYDYQVKCQDYGYMFQCGKAPLETLTLARWILEMSLMDYSYVTLPDSEMAAACLLLAMKMRDNAAKWVSAYMT